MVFENLAGFAGFPCQVYAASRSVQSGEMAKILETVAGFFPTWESHGSAVQGAAVVLENRFLIVAHRPQEISGCSRDSLLFCVQGLGKDLGLEWVGGSRVFYRDDTGAVADVDRLVFKQLAFSGRVTADTEVFDTAARQIDTVLQGRFALPAGRSWHARLLAAAPAPA